MKFVRFALLATLATSMLGNSSGAATTALQWHPTKIVALPSGGAAIAQGYLPALSCPSTGYCSAGGAYTDATNHTQGLLLDEFAGVWRAPIQLRPPSNAAADPTALVGALSCSSSGNCAAVGTYSDANSNVLSFVVNEVNGVWLSAREVALPTDALIKGQNSSVHSVACTSTGNCSAVGTYFQHISALGHRSGFALSEVRGVWRSATEIPAPSGGNTNSLITLNQLACSSPGTCVAVGSYVDVNNVTRGLVVTQVNGFWKASVTIVLPGNANAYASAVLSEISCASPGNCTALGTYTSNVGAIEGLAVTKLRGTWTRAVEIAMPANSAANPHAFLYGFTGIACRSIGNCSAGGQYLDGSGLYQGFLVNEVGGKWHTANVLALPSGAKATGKNGGVVAMSCHSVGNCSAGAAYVDQSGNYQALTVNEVGGIWQTGEKLTLPSGAATVGVNGGVYGLICTSTLSCTAIGTYLGAPGIYQGFTIATS
jgi:hypothetical protein